MHWDLRRFDQIDSTNSWLLAQARRGAPEGLVAVADHQSAGRGRLDRTWEAPPGASLLMSVLLRPDIEAGQAHLLTAAVAVAAGDAVEVAAGLRPGIKWPNDLVVDDRKLAGVLAEAISGARPVDAVVVGLGLNLNWPADGLLPTATAVNVETGQPVDRERVLDAVLERLSRWYADLPSVAREYRLRCGTVGRLVRVELAGESFTGRALDVDPDGHLLIDVGTCVRTVAAGDVIHLRQ